MGKKGHGVGSTDFIYYIEIWISCNFQMSGISCWWYFSAIENCKKAFSVHRPHNSRWTGWIWPLGMACPPLEYPVSVCVCLSVDSWLPTAASSTLPCYIWFQHVPLSGRIGFHSMTSAQCTHRMICRMSQHVNCFSSPPLDGYSGVPVS